jgi:energy-coupling factor transporter transmembrane protein EcfT
MPTFTDASLIAAGSGAVLWTLLAKEHSNRRRVFVGLLGFLALEAAVAVRYTDVVFLAVAAIVALLFCRRTGLPWRSLVWWFGSIAAFVGAILTWDQIVYGDAFKTGYANGEITFSLKSISPNVTHLPIHLVRSMPMLILGLLAIGWLSIRLVRSGDGRLSPEIQLRYRVDAAVGAALAAGWLGLWTLYSAYDWTVSQVSRGSVGSIHVIRFYLPAIGAIALLGAWLMKQLPGWVPTVIVVVQCGLGLMQSRTLAAAGPGGFGGPAGPVNGQLPPPGSLPGGPANGLP